jgi:hypothetical protein
MIAVSFYLNDTLHAMRDMEFVPNKGDIITLRDGSYEVSYRHILADDHRATQRVNVVLLKISLDQWEEHLGKST